MMQLDWDIISRANQFGLEELIPFEQAYLKAIRPMYSAAQWGAMVKVVKGSDGNEVGSGNINMTQNIIQLGQAHADAVRRQFSGSETQVYEFPEIEAVEAEERP